MPWILRIVLGNSGFLRSAAWLIVLLIALVSGTAQAQPSIWNVNGNAYEFVRSDGIFWPDARSSAAALQFNGLSGRLATISSIAENDFVADLIVNAKAKHNLPFLREAWLGAERIEPNAAPESTWEWVTSEPWQYTNWQTGEPNNLGGNEFYLGMWGPDGSGPLGQWNDQGDAFVAQNIQGYVVEYVVPEPSTAVLIVLVVVIGAFASLNRSANVFLSLRRFVAALGTVLFMGQSVAAVQIEMVTVDNPGNAPDTRYSSTGYGSVNYVFQIGKYEVTAREYTEFLNSVAKADPNGLYNIAMGMPGEDDRGANIQRAGVSPNYSYSVAEEWADRPVNYVSFWDAARFANWLHNGQPAGEQGPATTESGAYHDIGDNVQFGRNDGAKFFIPSEDEWYKSAYHDRNAGLTATYFDYPTRSYVRPGTDVTEITNPGNNSNQFTNSYVIGSPYYRTIAGEFQLSSSPYGTFDQAGNLYEMNESGDGMLRCIRGGGFDDGTFPFNAGPHASERYFPSSTFESRSKGFRVAGLIAVPESSTLFLVALGVVPLVVCRCRKTSIVSSGARRRPHTTGPVVLPSLIILVAISASAKADIPDGLIGYWPFDGDGSDASGFDRNLILQGGVGFASGLFGQSLDMHKNQSTYAQRTVDDAAYDLINDFTIQVWANYYSTSTEQVLLEKFVGANGEGWTFTKLASNHFRFAAYGLGVDSTPQAIASNTWQQLVLRLDGSRFHLLRNGVQIAVVDQSVHGFPSAAPLYVGRRNPGDSRDFSMNGRLDEVAIWNRALSDAEIAFLYNGGIGNPVIPVPEPSTPILTSVVCVGFAIPRRRLSAFCAHQSRR